VPGRPFFTVTVTVSRDAVLALHLTQKITAGWGGVVVTATPE
jgi:hypothetical protein